MQTRSSSRLVSNPSSNPTPSTNLNPKGRNRRRSKQRIEDFNLEELSPLIRFDESFVEAWDRFKDLLRACSHHGFSELHQLDTFYNALSSKYQDSFNSAAGGNFLDKMPRECLAIIESKSKVCYSRNKPVVAKVSTNTSTSGISPDVVELKAMVKALLLDKKGQNQSLAPVKAVEESYVTCGVVNYNQENTSYRPPMMSNQIQPPGFPLVPNNQNVQLNQRNNQNRFIPNQNRPITSPISEPVIAPVSAPKPNPKSSIPYTSRRNDERNHEKANNQIEKFYQVFKDMSFEISFADALILMPKFASTLKALIGNKEKMAECLALADLGASINIMPFFVWKRLSLPDLTPMYMTLELADRSMSHLVGVAEDVYVKVGSFHFSADFVVVDFEADPRVPLILGRSFLKTVRALIDVFEGELMLRVGKKSITFNLDQTSRYSANYSNVAAKRIDVIDMACEEYSQEVLGFSDTISSGNPTSYYDLIVSTTSPTLTPFKNSDFLLEEVDAFLAIEDDPTPPEFYQPYLDPEGDILLLEAFLNNDPSPPPNHGNYLPEVRKELKICLNLTNLQLMNPQRLNSKIYLPTSNMHSWKRVCIDYRILNEATRKDHFPLPFMDQMLERLAGNQYYYFLDSFSGYFQISVDPKHQEKTTFTCPYGTFAYHRMPFELCNAPGTFQRCMMAIFHDMIEKTIEVFMDDFSVFDNSFQSCLSHLERMLKKCEDTNLCLNWEKSHFMVKEGIVLGHKISKQWIEVDTAKVDVITKLPHPTTIKGIRSFLGYASFYRRFIKDFSKTARPMTRLLEKDTPFIFTQECVEAFQTLKRKLTKAPILIALDWDMPFELMCDASDYAIGAVLGKCQDKHFRPIHYASKTMTEAESNYTTTEKVMLAVTYAFEKFWSYLIMNKSIVYTDHSALKYLFAKKDSKARLLRWVLFLKEFTFKVIDTKGAEYLATDHLSRLENPHQNVLDPKEINESFPLEKLNLVSTR
nr:reverse transcriptase domain-containing protein [Tanacetum cinerariifolium]